MALIKCIDCNNDVSDQAPACPRCGRQIAATTIEKTSKSIKATQLLALLAIGSGFLLSCNDHALGAAVLLIFGGGLTYISAVMLKWWQHD